MEKKRAEDRGEEKTEVKIRVEKGSRMSTQVCPNTASALPVKLAMPSPSHHQAQLCTERRMLTGWWFGLQSLKS
jgi:hypothetical protein